MSSTSRSDFAAAVRQSVQDVQHLYGEVGRMYVDLRSALRSGNPPLSPLGGSPIKPPKSADRTIVRLAMGQLFSTMVEEEDEEPVEDADEVDEETEVEQETGKRSRLPIVVSASDRFLVVRIDIVDPTGTLLEPSIRCMVIGDWRVGGVPVAEFQLRKYQLRRLVTAVAPGVSKSSRVGTKARAMAGGKSRDRQVTFTVESDVISMPLFDIRSQEHIERYAEAVRKLMAATSSGQ